MNKDNFLLGVFLGIVVPLFGILLYYVLKYMPDNISMSDFLLMIKMNHYIIPKIISLGLIACIPLITYYKNRRQYTTLKGVFLSIILYALMAVLYKFNVL